MSKQRPVTEIDFRREEFRDAKPEDYEFRESDGKLVRKDRWERGINSIASIIGIRDFEISDVTEAVSKMVSEISQWIPFAESDFDLDAKDSEYSLMLMDGSIIKKAVCKFEVVDKDRQIVEVVFDWNGHIFKASDVKKYK